MSTMAGQEIHKRHVAASAQFAINHIPQADAATLEKLLELVNVEGNFGSITVRELLQKMDLLKKYIPATCETSLIILAELLGICWPMTTDTLNMSISTMKCYRSYATATGDEKKWGDTPQAPRPAALFSEEINS